VAVTNLLPDNLFPASESGLPLNNSPIQTKFPYKNNRQTALIESTVFAVHLSKPLGHLDLAFLLRVTGNRHDSFCFWDYRKLIGLNFLFDLRESFF
jgi:hypothetical protein